MGAGQCAGKLEFGVGWEFREIFLAQSFGWNVKLYKNYISFLSSTNFQYEIQNVLESPEHTSKQILTFLINDKIFFSFFFFERCCPFNTHRNIKYWFDTFVRIVLFNNIIIQAVMYRNQYHKVEVLNRKLSDQTEYFIIFPRCMFLFCF